MIIIASLAMIISVSEIKKVSKILFITLLFTASVLLYLQYSLGLSWINVSYAAFVSSLPSVNLLDFSGVLLPTILVTFIGMDFHQFIVRSKSVKDAVLGNILGGVVLLIISFLLLNVVYASIQSGFVQNIQEPTQVIPAILSTFGQRVHPLLGKLLPLVIVFVAVGSGSGLQRIIIDTLKTFWTVKKNSRDIYYAAAISLFCIFLALTGNSIIKLIVDFYSIYVGSVFLPFVFLLIQSKYPKIAISPKLMIATLYFGFAATTITFFMKFMPISYIKSNSSALIIAAGFGATLLAIVISAIISKQTKNLG
jgi:solute:Na+ symporter, SSS family